MTLIPTHTHTWLQVLMSTPPFRSSRTLSRFPALAARRKLVLLSDCGEDGESDGWMTENERETDG